MPEEKEGKKDFVVKDRRIFAEQNQDGEPKEKKETPPAEKEKKAKAEKEAEAKTDEGGKEPDAGTQEPPPQFPEINFSTFVVSLNASALLNLGVIEDPASGTKNKNLPMAKQTIDILSMLQEKTTGNLSEEEENLLKNILYDLRMMYVKEKQ